MKTLTRLLFYSFLFTGLFFSCDDFLEDVKPAGEFSLVLDKSKYTMQGTPVIIDLASAFQTEKQVSFKVSLDPSKGKIEFQDAATIKYTPNVDFSEGKDIFAISLFDVEDSIELDIDSLEIVMSTAQDEIPCENGAMSDVYYMSDSKGFIVLNILDNDGICSDQYEFDIRKGPDYGKFISFSGDSLVYEKVAPFEVAQDIFTYRLKQKDASGEELISMGEVIIYFHSDSSKVPTETCPESFPNKTYTLDVSEETNVTVMLEYEVYFPVDSCQVDHWVVSVDQSIGGDAFASQDSSSILFSPDPSDSGAVINYKIIYADGQFHQRSIAIDYLKDVQTGCGEVLESAIYYEVFADKSAFIYPIYKEDSACNVSKQVDIVELTGGNVSFNANLTELIFTPDYQDSVANVIYDYFLGNEVFRKSITIFYTDFQDTTSCNTRAVADEYYFVSTDSVGNETLTFYFDPAQNDEICGSDFDITISKSPDLGQLTILESGRFEYYVPEEFAGVKETLFEYEICSDGTCDNSQVIIYVEK